MDRRPELRRHVRRVDDVLHADRQPVEQTAGPDRRVTREVDPRVQLGLQRGDPRPARRDDVRGRCALRERVRQRQPPEVAHDARRAASTANRPDRHGLSTSVNPASASHASWSATVSQRSWDMRSSVASHSAAAHAQRECLRPVALAVDGVELGRRTQDLLRVDEHPAGRQHVVDAREQRPLAGGVEVVDRQRGDDRVPGTLRQRIAEIGGHVRRPVAEPLARLGQHLPGTVEQHELRLRVRAGDHRGEQPRARPEVEHASDGRRDEAEGLERRAVERVEVGDEPTAQRVVVPCVLVEDCRGVRHHRQLYVIPSPSARPRPPRTWPRIVRIVDRLGLRPRQQQRHERRDDDEPRRPPERLAERLGHERGDRSRTASGTEPPCELDCASP